MSNSNPPTEQAPAPPAPPMNIIEAIIPAIDATQTLIKPHSCQLPPHLTDILIEEAFGAFVKDMGCLVPRFADIDSAELIVRSLFTRLINALREPYMDAIRALDQRVTLASRQRYHTPRLHNFMDRTTPKLCTLKEKHQLAIIAYQTYIINYLRSQRASERTYQATLISLQKSQLAAAQKIGVLHTRLRADLEDHQRGIIQTNELISALKKTRQAEFAANPTDSGRLVALRKFQAHSLIHQATMVTNAQNISRVEERMRSMIAARQVYVNKTAREIAGLEAKHDHDVAKYRAEMRAQATSLMGLVYCQHQELTLVRMQLMGEVSAACQKVVAVGAVAAGSSTDPDGDLD